ncbi:lipoprotein [Advenella faeciporci]|uniref:Lipoprotein n=1 Tax=Advenella faeciporci TaxID=797535 RepID=A0A918JJ93_9BURK|nr:MULTISPECIES: TssQ family T6SS-associated lipoprotein [Advenella]GGW83053.1 lipoprotein [Advenella faeciporci]
MKYSSKKSFSLLSGSILISLALSACTTAPKEPPSPYSPEEEVVLETIKTEFANGNYKTLITQIKAEPLMLTGSLAFRTEALKFQAFSECVSKRRTACGKTFNKMLSGNPDYTLDPAESTHPTWGPVFERENKKVQASRLRVEKQLSSQK